jgi:hypothetical protein
VPSLHRAVHAFGDDPPLLLRPPARRRPDPVNTSTRTGLALDLGKGSLYDICSTRAPLQNEAGLVVAAGVVELRHELEGAISGLNISAGNKGLAIVVLLAHAAA